MTPVAPFKICSKGVVINCSTSSGTMACASVMIVTVGRFKSGKTSMVILEAKMALHTAITTAPNMANWRILSECAIIFLIIFTSFYYKIVKNRGLKALFTIKRHDFKVFRPWFFKY